VSVTAGAVRSVDIAIEGRRFVLTARRTEQSHYEWECLVAEVLPDGALSMWDVPISNDDPDMRQTLLWGAHLLMAYVLSDDGDIR
jgi:hypothetical protein